MSQNLKVPVKKIASYKCERFPGSKPERSQILSLQKTIFEGFRLFSKKNLKRLSLSRVFSWDMSQPAITCSKLKIKTVEPSVKYIRS